MYFPADQFMYYRTLYGQLWSRCVSSDSRASLIVMRLSWDTLTWQGFGLVNELRQLLRESPEVGDVQQDPCNEVRGQELSDASIWYDYIVLSVGMLPKAVGLACIITTPLIGIYFNSVVAALKLLLTVVLPLTWVYGFAVWTFQDGLFDSLGLHLPIHSSGGLHWMVPCSTTMLLLALALDYNVFYFGRIVEFRRAGVSDVEAICQGLASTGPVITCAGLIFALEFSGLLFSETVLNRQGGFVVVTGILLDTFVVRSCLLPAMLSLGAAHNWWPAKMPPPLSDDELSIAREGSRASVKRQATLDGEEGYDGL